MILRGSVFSKTLDMDTGITIVAPNQSEKSSEANKVVYLLHGICSNNGSWVDYTMLPVYAAKYNATIIMPEVMRSFYTDMKFGMKYFSYITEELPVLCENIFNISSKGEDTSVIGASMGGYGALKCALTRPEKYSNCCAISSACLFIKEGMDFQRNPDNYEVVKSMYGEQLMNDFYAAFGSDLAWKPDYDILELAKKTSHGENKPKILCTCGTDDYFVADNRRFSDEMKNLELDYTYEEWAGVHDWVFFDQSIKRALEFCLE